MNRSSFTVDFFSTQYCNLTDADNQGWQIVDQYQSFVQEVPSDGLITLASQLNLPGATAKYDNPLVSLQAEHRQMRNNAFTKAGLTWLYDNCPDAWFHTELK
jgi:hypothetical protein